LERGDGEVHALNFLEGGSGPGEADVCRFLTAFIWLLLWGGSAAGEGDACLFLTAAFWLLLYFPKE
jgi:hypothetical protein